MDRIFRLVAILVTCACLPVFSKPAVAEPQFSGFLSDYSQLQVVPDQPSALSFLSSDAQELFERYEAIMVDQPEIFISPDSKYRGAKPDELKALSDSFRATITDTLSSKFQVVEEPGPNVLFVRLAASNLHIKKKKRLTDFTPVGLVTNATGVKDAVRAAISDDIAKRLSLIELTIEAELLDSETGERLAALVVQRGQAKDKTAGLKQEPTSWKELDELIQAFANRLVCRLTSARPPDERRIDCLSL